MPRFKDTPRWKTRQAYENAKKANPPKRKALKATSVSCPVCGAERGRLCIEPYRRQEPYQPKRERPHFERIEKARAVSRARCRGAKRRREFQERRWATATIRFECPICGGNHSRADHPKVAGRRAPALGKPNLPRTRH
jgi:transcription elongation factor Elf1